LIINRIPPATEENITSAYVHASTIQMIQDAGIHTFKTLFYIRFHFIFSVSVPLSQVLYII